jgi:2-dehydropantoate 2-reductase
MARRRKSKEKKDEQIKAMRILSFGAGAIGTYIGGSLALHKHQVVFLEKPDVVEDLRQRGLSLEIDEEIQQIPAPQVAGSMEEALQAGPFDLAIFALKSFETQKGLESMAPHIEAMPPVLCLQNGVDNETALAQILGPKRVIPGTVTSAVGRRAAGDIVLERKRGMGVGASHPLASDLVDALNDAGLNARLYRHALDMKWSKMLTNLLANASSAILNMTPTEIFEHPELHRLEIRQLREALQVMNALHLNPVDLPGTPIRALTFSVRNLPTKLSRTLLKNAVGSGRGGKMPSFHIDLHNGRGKSEVNYLNGAVVRHGERVGVKTPVNQLLNETLLKLTRGDLPLMAFDHNPERLLALLKE